MFDFSKDEIGIGVDIEKINRFESTKITNTVSFLNRVFTQKELDYCFSGQTSAQRLAGRFACKEAIFKAVSIFGEKKLAYREIHIINGRNGIPNANIQREDYRDVNIIFSLSNTKELVIAFAIATRPKVKTKTKVTS